MVIPEKIHITFYVSDVSIKEAFCQGICCAYKNFRRYFVTVRASLKHLLRREASPVDLRRENVIQV